MARVASGATRISRQTIEVDHTRMTRWIAQKFHGRLLRNKNKLACSCHQMLPISPDGCPSGPHAARGLLCDQSLKRADNIRVIRAFRGAEPVPRKQQPAEMVEVRDNKGELEFRNPQSETGNPTAGWESGGQIRNPKSEIIMPFALCLTPLLLIYPQT